VAGIAVLLAVVGIGALVVSVSWLQNNAEVTRDVGAAAADAAFAAEVGTFPDPRPVVEFGADRRPRMTEGIADRSNPGTVTMLHVLAWDAREGTLARVALPMWLIRLKSGPIEFGAYASGMDDLGVRLDVSDIDRYGPGVLIDYTSPARDRVLFSAH
jgi:hypothetical protein